MNLDFLVRKDDLRDTRWQETPLPQPGVDQVLLRVDRFALTANNITYAVAGERMGYWQFFPAEAGWGRIPVWGFAEVVESAHAGLAPGERVYGYLPMSSHLLVTAGEVSEHGFADVSAHRAELPGVYNQFQRTAADPGYDPGQEDAQMLYRPLFMTSFILDDFLADNDFFGASLVILTSASSKTSLGLAHLLSARAERCRVLGLTSDEHVDFVQDAGCYHRVLSYPRIVEIPPAPSVIVDMAGNGAALAAVHNHLGDNLRYSCLVGATHWEARHGASDMAGPKPELFFAPTHIQRRSKEWGPGGLQARFAAAWASFIGAASGWITVQHAAGRDAVEDVYRRTLNGEVVPSRGWVLSVTD